jgi:hypothetical protein
MRANQSKYFIVLMFLCSCAGTNREPSPYHGLSDAEQIYSLVFDMTLGPDSSYAPDALFFHPHDLPDSVRLRVRIGDRTGYDRLPEAAFRYPDIFMMKQGFARNPAIRVDTNIDKEFLRILHASNKSLDSTTAFNREQIHSRYAYSLIPDGNWTDKSGRIFQPVGIGFSRIAFSSDSAKAVVYREYHCGDLCANGTFWFLIKTRGDWSFYASFMSWIS